jgi:hypothetical protein
MRGFRAERDAEGGNVESSSPSKSRTGMGSCETIGCVSLTLGPGPLGNQPAGIYNRELPVREGLLYLEPTPRRIRGYADGEVVVDSRHARLLYEHGRLPIYMFPREEVRTELLEPGERATESTNKGPAR